MRLGVVGALGPKSTINYYCELMIDRLDVNRGIELVRHDHPRARFPRSCAAYRWNVSNCIESQALCVLCSPVRDIELSMVSSLWAHAIRATFGGLPCSRSRT